MVSANTEKINMPTFPLGLSCVAQAILKAEHDLESLDLMAEGDTEGVISGAIEKFQPNLIGISVRNIDDQNMVNPKFFLDQARDVVAYCKNLSGAQIVLGGAGYSIFPQSALEYLGADMGIQGEGEGIFPVLLKSLEEGRSLSGLPGLYIRGSGLQGKRCFVKDLDSFPLPDPCIFSTSAYEGEDFWVPVQTRRGCPMRCSYCSAETVEGYFIRKRSPDLIVEWLGKWVKSGFSHFQFVDNTFNLPPSYAATLCYKLAEAPFDIFWRCILYPGNIEEKLVKAMARAGCKEVSLGFESGCDKILNEMNKHFKSQDVRYAAKMLSDYGIHTMGFLLLGGPGENKDTVEESLEFIDTLNLNTLRITLGIRIYPYTKLTNIALEEGVIAEDDDLLSPRFYMVRGLEGWLRETVEDRIGERPNWII